MRTNNTAVHKALRVLKALPGNEMNGISNGELAQATNLSPSAITRIMQALIDEGLATKLDNERFAASIRFGQLAMRTLSHLDTTRARLDELQRRLGNY